MLPFAHGKGLWAAEGWFDDATQHHEGHGLGFDGRVASRRTRGKAATEQVFPGCNELGAVRACRDAGGRLALRKQI